MIKRVVFCLWVLSVGLTHTAAAQSLGRGTVIVSTDSLDGTMFEQTVMLLVHHDTDGSIGIMINRPTNLQPAEIYPDIAGAESYTGTLFFGGPLASARPFLITRGSSVLEDVSVRIIDGVYLSGDPSLLNSLDETQRSATFTRLYSGSAQWGPGQLRNEVAAGAWQVTAANAGLVFHASPENLWSRMNSAPVGSDTASLPAERNSEASTLVVSR